MSFKKLHQIVGIFLCLIMMSCNAYLHQPMKSTPARIGEETSMAKSLRKLPPPQEKLVAAVYKFTDQTGQYKPSETGAGWSKAVTQGATNILIKSLEESGWFIPIERENVQNLLNERKIIRSSRMQYLNEQERAANSALPPLLFAGIILEGGIVSYDANVLTGGAGIRYFGIGGGGQYRQDRVTIYLRAISVSSGQILKTVYTSKTILSQAMDGGLFQFVKFKRLLEIETGFTFNEPSELAVTEAIEKAVQTLVLEGIVDQLWAPVPTAEKETRAALAAFKIEKAEMQETDFLGRKLTERKEKVALQINGAATLYQGELRDATPKYGGEIGLQYFHNDALSTALVFGCSQLGTREFFETKISYVELNSIWRWMPRDKVTPYLFGGIGIIGKSQNAPFDFSGDKYAKLNLGLGFEYRINDRISTHVSIDQNYLLDDRIDDLETGKYNDYFWRGRLGLKVFFGKK